MRCTCWVAATARARLASCDSSRDARRGRPRGRGGRGGLPSRRRGADILDGRSRAGRRRSPHDAGLALAAGSHLWPVLHPRGARSIRRQVGERGDAVPVARRGRIRQVGDEHLVGREDRQGQGRRARIRQCVRAHRAFVAFRAYCRRSADEAERLDVTDARVETLREESWEMRGNRR